MAEGVNFDAWISERFRALNTDEAVFAPYVKSIVEGDESTEEKVEALDGILAELADGTLDVEEFRKEILLKWDQHNNAKAETEEGAAGDDLKSKFENIMKLSDEVSDANDSARKGGKNHNQVPDKDLRAAILNNYRDDDSDDEESREGRTVSAAVPRGGGEGGSKSNLERNTNAERVLNEIKDKREKEKADAAKKRERDKEDRTKQKQQAQDRKEKAKKKAAKVERKR